MNKGSTHISNDQPGIYEIRVNGRLDKSPVCHNRLGKITIQKHSFENVARFGKSRYGFLFIVVRCRP